MAQMHSQFAYTGSIGALSAYKRRDLDKIIVRLKGGPSKEQIKKAPQFDITRRINAEFGGRATASKYLMQTLWPLKRLADYNIAGSLNALIKPIQEMDTDGEYGKRSVCFTKNPRLLEGFNFNRNNPFDSIVRNPLSYTLSKEELSAAVDIPAMMPGLNFFVPPGRHPYYSFEIAGGVVPDLIHTVYGYKPVNGQDNFSFASAHTEWYPVSKGSTATSLHLDLKKQDMVLFENSFSVMLSIGIRFGTAGVSGNIEQVKYAGAAKVVGIR